MAGPRFLNRVLADVATRRGLHHEELAGGWVVRIGNGHRHLETFGFQLSLNTVVAASLARDKAAAAERLERDGVPVVPCALVLAATRQGWLDGRSAEAVLDEALARTPPPVVIKPNEGTSGADVHRADDAATAHAVTRALLAREPSAVVQPLVPIGREERWVLLGDEPLVRYGKAPVPGPLPMFNLALGGTVTTWGVDDGDPADLELARRARRSLGLVAAAVDLVTDDDGRTAVMEVNSGWSFEHLVRVRPASEDAAAAAYEAAVDCALGLRRP